MAMASAFNGARPNMRVQRTRSSSLAADPLAVRRRNSRHGMIMRGDFRGTPKDWLIWGPLTFGPGLLQLYGLRRFQILLDPDDRLIFRGSLVGYGVHS